MNGGMKNEDVVKCRPNSLWMQAEILKCPIIKTLIGSCFCPLTSHSARNAQLDRRKH